MLLEAEKVSAMFKDCLYGQEEIIDGKPNVEPIIVDGVKARFGLHPDRVSKYKVEIGEMTRELPIEFDEGWSFLNLGHKRNGEQWTGFHQRMEEFLVLGIATGNMEYNAPKEMWGSLPGQVPYVKVVSV